MKTLKEYINESLILEKFSLTKLSEQLADKIIDIINNNSEENIGELKDIDKSLQKKYPNAKVYKISGIKYNDKQSTLYIIVNENSEEASNTYDNDLSFKDDNNLGYIIINIPEGKNIEDNSDSLSHELRHYYDQLSEQDVNNRNNTYEPNKDEGLWDGFLYRISPTEQNAFYTGFKKWINKNDNLEKFKSYYSKLESKNVDDFIEKLSKMLIEKRHNLLKANNKQNEKELANEDQGSVENPIRILEYNYYILDSFEHFEEFINKDLITGKERSDEDKQYIINHLATFTNGDTSDLKKIYNNIKSKYKQTFNSYKTLLQKVLK